MFDLLFVAICRESGEWARLGQLGGMQREANLRQLVHMANFHCVTATDIVNSLTLITHSIQVSQVQSQSYELLCVSIVSISVGCSSCNIGCFVARS